MSRPLPYLGVQVLQPPRDLGQVHEADIRAEAEAGLGLRAVVAVIREPLESRWRAVRWAVEDVSYTHLRAHETKEKLVCRLQHEKKNKQI